MAVCWQRGKLLEPVRKPGLGDRKQEPVARKMEPVDRKPGQAVHRLELVVRKLELAARRPGPKGKPELVARKKELAVRRQEPWHKPVQMERLRTRGQELFHRQPAVERKLGPVQHRNTEQEECKELGRPHKKLELGEQLRKSVAEERRPELEEQHRKIAAEERKKKQQEQIRTTVVGDKLEPERHRKMAAGKLELERARKMVEGKLELELLHKLELLGQRRRKEPEQFHRLAVGGRPEREPHRLERLVRKPGPEECKELELRQRKPIQHRKTGLVARKTRRIEEPEPGRSLPLAGGQRGWAAGYRIGKSGPEDRDAEVGRI